MKLLILEEDHDHPAFLSDMLSCLGRLPTHIRFFLVSDRDYPSEVLDALKIERVIKKPFSLVDLVKTDTIDEKIPG